MNDTLPGVLDVIAAELGLGVALAIAKEMGGEQIYVSCRSREFDRLARAVGGREMAARVVALIGGGAVDIPRLAARSRATRNRAIVAARQGGATQNQVARSEGLTVRQIRNIEAGRVADPRQGKLL